MVERPTPISQNTSSTCSSSSVCVISLCSVDVASITFLMGAEGTPPLASFQSSFCGEGSSGGTTRCHSMQCNSQGLRRTMRHAHQGRQGTCLRCPSQWPLSCSARGHCALDNPAGEGSDIITKHRSTQKHTSSPWQRGPAPPARRRGVAGAAEATSPPSAAR